MRILMVTVAIMALAAAPCAWDTDPRDASAIGALVGGLMASPGQAQAMPRPGTPIALDGVLK